MKFKPYPKYKASGVEWLGDVPNEWTVKALKYIGWFKGGAGFPHEDQGVQGQAIPFFKVKHLEGASRTGHISDHEHTISEETANRLGANIFPENTIVFAKVGAALLLGRIRFLGLRSCIDNNMMGFQLLHPDAVPRFIWYSMSRIRFDEIANPGAVPSLNEGQISTQLICFPDRAEQSAIATFLDRETAKIDTLIAKQEKLIDLLKEKRQAVISQAVTKGLDPTVPMKPSGVEWLGDVPEHWKTGALRRVAIRIVVGIAEAATHAYSDVGIPILRATNIRAGKIIGNILRVSAEYSEGRDSKTMQAGDLVTVRTGNAGVTAVIPLELNGSQCFTMLITTLDKYCDSKFYCYYMNSDIARAYFSLEGWGTAQINISVPILQNLPIPIPPIEEQQTIVTYLEKTTDKIDTLIAKAQQAIALQKEHRTALISAAVTGKIDVREASFQIKKAA